MNEHINGGTARASVDYFIGPCLGCGEPTAKGCYCVICGARSQKPERVVLPVADLRDYFAAKALQAEIITTCSDATPEAAENACRAADESGATITDHIAQNAYKWADAMLRAREAK